MQKEIFAKRLRGLLPAPDEQITARWLDWAEECAQFYGEHRYYTDALLRLTSESVLEEFHAGLFLASQKYGGEATQKVYELIQDHALYAHELLGAAAFFYGGGTRQEAVQRSIDEMFDSDGLMGPMNPWLEQEKSQLADQIRSEQWPFWAGFFPGDRTYRYLARTLYTVREKGEAVCFLSTAGAGHVPYWVLTVAADAVRTQGCSFLKAMDGLDVNGKFIPGLPVKLRLMERLPEKDAEWLREGFDCNDLLHQSVELDFDNRIVSMECNPITHPQMNPKALARQTAPIPESVFRLASPVLIPETSGQETPSRKALYTIVEDGEERYLGGAASCTAPFLALYAAEQHRRPYESAADALVHLTNAALPYYKPDVNAEPVFYPVTPERAEQLLAEFGKTDETAMLVRLELNCGMARLEHNALCYPTGHPCDFSIPIDEGRRCLQEIMDEIAATEASDPHSLDVLMLGKIESSLRQIGQDGMTEMGPCS